MVIVILGMVAAMAMPRYAGFMATRQLEAAARRIAADLALAREQARLTSAAKTVTFDALANCYTLTGVSDPDRAGASYEVCMGEEPYRATLVTPDFGGDAEIIFDGYGVPDSGGSVVIRVGSLQETVSLEAGTGRAQALGVGDTSATE